MKKIIAVLMTLCMLAALAACGGSDKSSDSAGTETGSVVTGVEAIDTVGEDGIDWNHMSMDELYEMAKKEGGTVTIYATTADADTARKYIRDKYPDIKFEYISCDTNTVMQKIGMEAQSGTPMADVLMVKDASGEVYNEYVLWDLVKIYYPADVCAHIKDDMLRFGLPLYSTFKRGDPVLQGRRREEHPVLDHLLQGHYRAFLRRPVGPAHLGQRQASGAV